MSGTAKRMARGLLAAALFGAPLPLGCDASRPELDATRGKLDAMTTERDGLQKQLVAARAELIAVRKAAQTAALNRGETVKHTLYDGHFESNQSGLKGDASFITLRSQKDFDQTFGTAAVMGAAQHFVPKDAFEAKIIIAAIRRGTSAWTYAVDKVSADQGILYVQYKATARPAGGSATSASPLILSVDKGPYASVGFIENGKLVGTASVGN